MSRSQKSQKRELLLSAKAFLPGFLLFAWGQNENILVCYN